MGYYWKVFIERVKSVRERLTKYRHINFFLQICAFCDLTPKILYFLLASI